MRFPLNQSLRQRGFTLIELVAVIIILSALGIMTSSFIGTGVDIYTGIADRDKTINSVRFAMERLRREVANALPNSALSYKLPNSVNVRDDCLSFWNIEASSIYAVDFPIKPLFANSGKIAAIKDYTFVSGDKAVVYLLASKELTDKTKNRVKTITSFTGNNMLHFANNTRFDLASPAKRVYIIRDKINYCFAGSELTRQVNSDKPVKMADNVAGGFSASLPTLQRNGLVQVTFNIGQEIPIEQTLHINNVP